MAAARIAREQKLIEDMREQGKAAAGTEKLPEGTGLAGVKDREPVPEFASAVDPTESAPLPVRACFLPFRRSAASRDLDADLFA